jgi:hypothetical protein
MNIENYNYDKFIPENFEPLMRFNKSPALGVPAPDFPLWNLEDCQQTSLKDLWSNHLYLVVEFGSFT